MRQPVVEMGGVINHYILCISACLLAILVSLVIIVSD